MHLSKFMSRLVQMLLVAVSRIWLKSPPAASTEHTVEAGDALTNEFSHLNRARPIKKSQGERRSLHGILRFSRQNARYNMVHLIGGVPHAGNAPKTDRSGFACGCRACAHAPAKLSLVASPSGVASQNLELNVTPSGLALFMCAPTTGFPSDRLTAAFGSP